MMDDSTEPDLDAVLQELWPELVRFVERRAGRAMRESATDIAQSACREWLARGDRSASPTIIRQWIFRQADTKLIDRLRFHQAQKRDVRREVTLQSDACAVPETPSRVMMSREAVDELERRLASLPEDHARLIRMTRIDQMHIRDAAKTLGKSEAAARRMLSRALARLSERID